MPELPEVYTIVKDLRNMGIIRKSVIEETLIMDPVFCREMIGSEDQYSKLTSIRRLGRYIIFGVKFSYEGPWTRFIASGTFEFNRYMIIHLGMTGSILYFANLPKTKNGIFRSTHARTGGKPMFSFRFNGGQGLVMSEIRKFGCVKTTAKLSHAARLRSVGPSPIGKEADWFAQRILKCQGSRMIKQVIMDGKTFDGIGNIYACDILNMSRINPTKRNISSDEAVVIGREARTALETGIRNNGCSFKNFIRPSGLRGGYDPVIYQKASCKNCGSNVLKAQVAGRSTYWCGKCQV